MISTNPLPQWSALLSAAIGGNAGVDNDPESAWSDRRFQIWLSRGAWAFLAVAQWLRRNIGRNPTVWVPDYFCSPSLSLLRLSGARILYYCIGDDLCPDLGDMGRLMKLGHPDILVIVHYFGIPVDFSQMLSKLEKAPEVVIEDAAHVLRPCSGVGLFGDVVLYCPHKHVGIPHGAVLVAREAVMAQEIEQELHSFGDSSPKIGHWYIRKALQKALPDPARRLLRSVPQSVFLSDSPAPSIGSDCRMNSAVHTLLRRAQIDRLATYRVQADLSLRKSLAEAEGWKPLREAWGDATPYRTVMRCKDQSTAEARYALFRSKGYPVETWGSLPEEVKADEATHDAAHRLRKTILLFPFDFREPDASAKFAKRVISTES